MFINPAKFRFYTEKYEKENRNLQLFENFKPSSHAVPVTGKFYARHDALDKIDPPDEYITLLKKKSVMLPTEIYSYHPPSMNMQ